MRSVPRSAISLPPPTSSVRFLPPANQPFGLDGRDRPAAQATQKTSPGDGGRIGIAGISREPTRRQRDRGRVPPEPPKNLRLGTRRGRDGPPRCSRDHGQRADVRADGRTEPGSIPGSSSQIERVFELSRHPAHRRPRLRARRVITVRAVDGRSGRRSRREMRRLSSSSFFFRRGWTRTAIGLLPVRVPTPADGLCSKDQTAATRTFDQSHLSRSDQAASEAIDFHSRSGQRNPSESTPNRRNAMHGCKIALTQRVSAGFHIEQPVDALEQLIDIQRLVQEVIRTRLTEFLRSCLPRSYRRCR